MRLTIKNPGWATNYRLPLMSGDIMYALEAEEAGVNKQEGRFTRAYFGKAVDKTVLVEQNGVLMCTDCIKKFSQKIG